jgi:hypothetical protein
MHDAQSVIQAISGLSVIDDQLSALLDDRDFRDIHGRMGRFNLFEALGAVHAELRHSNFLAYLLSPNRPHGLEARPLQQVLRRALETIPVAERPLSTLELLVGDLDDAIVHRERDSIDLLIEIDALQLVVVIENKIKAKAGVGQLMRYRELIEARYPGHRRLFIFLTPEGTSPDDPGYHSLSYVNLAEMLETLAKDLPQGDATRLIVSHYVDMLRKNIVEDDHLRELAARLYERHAEALDFIFDNRPRPASMLGLVAQRVRASEGLVVDTDGVSMLRFAPEQWDGRLSFASDPKDWTPSGRGLLFEIKSHTNKPGRISLSLVLGPGDADYRAAFYEAAKHRPDIFKGLVKPMGVKWSTVFGRDLMTAERAATLSVEAQATNIDLAWTDFQQVALPTLIDAVLEIDAGIAAARTSR